MEELKRCPHEELTFAPYLWLRVRALEAWLNDRARQGWSLAAMDGHDALLVQDGARARYRAVLVRRQRGVDFDAAAADLLARRRAEGWSFLGACDGVHIFVDREGRAADFEGVDTVPTARRLAAGRAALRSCSRAQNSRWRAMSSGAILVVSRFKTVPPKRYSISEIVSSFPEKHKRQPLFVDGLFTEVI